MPDIFLSYKREDARTAARLVEGLRASGFDVWWDADIPVGAAWEATIERALTDAGLVLVCWSRAAVTSENVRSEARWAREQGRLIQLFVEPCEPPLFFGERQGIDVSHWTGDHGDPRFQRLVAQVRATLGHAARPDTAAPSAPPPPIAAWLETLDLGRFADAFAAAEVNLETLPALDDADLKEIGIPLGPRRRILAALAAGAPVAADPVPPIAPRDARANPAERRQITVVSIDLADADRLAVELDPEMLGDILDRYKAGVTAGIAAAGGHVVKAVGDGVLACFGWPEAREDATESAVRAGFGVIATVGRIERIAGHAMRSRIGIATGLVVVGGEPGGALDRASITGEAPNLAATLRQMAAPDTIAISDATHRQVERLFECEPLGDRSAGGSSPVVRGWRPIREIAHRSRFQASRAVKTSFVGRAHELSLLADRWQIASEGSGRTVVVMGEAGMGKSRLLDALQGRIADDPHVAITWQCSPYHRTKPLYPAVEYLTHAAGIADTDAAAEQRRKLAGVIEAAGMRAAENLALFAQLLALPPDTGVEPPVLPASQARTATIAALIDWLRCTAARAPVLFVLEDAHWIDATMLELLTRLVGSIDEVPLLAVITARPEFVSPWAGRAEVGTIGLDRLGKRDCEILAREVAGAAALRGRTVDEIVARSDGNPLFVEELGAAVSDTGSDAKKGVPDSLQSSLMGRLDRLGDAKQTAQLCSVLGRRFARPLLAQVAGLAPLALDTSLSLLVDHDIVRPIGGAGDGRYEFKHALVRDAAYESMLLSQRRRLHEACGRALEQSFPEVVRTEPELLAQHFGLAGEPRKAAIYAEQAGDRATAACAFHEAVASYEEALRQNALLPDEPDRDRQALGVLLKLGPAIGMIRGAQDPELRRVYIRAEALSRVAGDTDAQFKAVWGLWYNANIARELDDAAAFAERLVEIGDQAGDEDLALEAIHCRWSSAWFRGDYPLCVADSEQGIELYDRHRHHRLGLAFGGHDPGVCAFGCKGQALVCAGDVERGFDAIDEAIGLAEALDHPGSLVHAIMTGMVAATVVRSPERLRPLTERMLDLARRFNLPPQHAMGSYHLAWVNAESGDRAAGLDAMTALYERVTAIGPIVLLYKVMYVEQLLRAGRGSDALAAADRAVADLRFPDRGLVLPELLRLRGDSLAAVGRREEALAELNRAEAMAIRDGAGLLRLRAAGSRYRLGDDGARQSLEAALTAIPANWGGSDMIEARELLAA